MDCGRVNMGFVKKGEEGGKEERGGEGGKGGGRGRRGKEEEVEVADGGYAQVRDVRL